MFEKCSLEAYNGNDFHSSSCWMYIEGWYEMYIECSGLALIMPAKRVYSVNVFLLCVLHVLLCKQPSRARCEVKILVMSDSQYLSLGLILPRLQY